MSEKVNRVKLNRDKDHTWNQFLILVSDELNNSLSISKYDKVKSRIFFVRHGSSDSQSDNRKKNKDNEIDLGLNEVGISEIEQVSNKFLEIGLGIQNTLILYNDDSKRVIETVKIMKNSGVGVDWLEERLHTTEKQLNEKGEIIHIGNHVQVSSQMALNSAELMLGIKEVLGKIGTGYCIILVGHKSNKAGISEFVNKERGDSIVLEGRIGTGEIMEFDLDERGEYINYQKNLHIFRLGLNNFNIVKQELDGIIKKFMYRNAHIRELQNFINAYFRANPELYKEFLLSKSPDIRQFCAINLIKGFHKQDEESDEQIGFPANPEFVLENMIKLIELSKKDNTQKIIQTIFDAFDDEYKIKYIEQIDNTTIGKSIDIHIENEDINKHRNFVRQIKPNIDFLRQKSLDSRIINGEELPIKVEFTESKYNSIPELLKGTGTILIQGEAGAGKSIKMLEILEYGLKNGIYPLYIHLGSVNLRSLESEINYNQQFQTADVILLDALDESRFNKEEIKKFFEIVSELSKYKKIIITSRPGSVSQLEPEDQKRIMPQLELLDMKPLSIHQIDEYVDKTLDKQQKQSWEKLKGTDFIKEIESNPLILYMLCKLIENKEDLSKIQTKGDLYEMIVNERLLSEGQKDEYEKITIQQLELRKQVLGEIAYQMGIKGNLDEKQINQIIKKYSGGFKCIDSTPGEEKYNLNCLNLIFKKDQEGNYQFVHESFKEYFWVRYLESNFEIINILFYKSLSNHYRHVEKIFEYKVMNYINKFESLIYKIATCFLHFLVLCDRIDNIEIMKYLVELKDEEGKRILDVNAKTESGRTGFMNVCSKGEIEVVKYLCELRDENGKRIVDITEKDDNGVNGFRYACSKGEIEIVKYLCELRDENGKRILDINESDKTLGTGFMRACVEGNFEVVKYLCELRDENGKRILDINAKTESGRTGFTRVCGAGEIEVVKYLCELRDENGKRILDINEKDYNGVNGFRYACMNGQIEEVKYLCELRDEGGNRIVDINEKNNDGVNGFMYACCYGKLEVVKYLYELRDEGGNRIVDINKNGNNYLMWACINGEIEVVKYLYELRNKDGKRIVNINEKDENGITGFMKASEKGNLEIVKYLYELRDENGKRVVDINEKDYNGVNGFRYACINGEIEIVKYLCGLVDEDGKMLLDISEKKNDLGICFTMVCHMGNLEVIKYLCELRDENGKRILNINEKDKHGRTGFMIVCFYGKLEVVKYLCELTDKNGKRIVSINEKDNKGNNGFMEACQNGKLEVVKYLCELTDKNGKRIVSINEKDNKGNNGFMNACCYGKLEVVKYLYELKDEKGERIIFFNKGDINYFLKFSNSKLLNIFIIFCKIGQIEVVKYLCELKDKNGKRIININKKDDNEDTGFIRACKEGNFEVVKYLCELRDENGKRILNINEKDKRGNSGFIYFCEEGNFEVVEYLCELMDENGKRIVNINEKNKYGSTGFMYACYYGKIEVVKYLYELKDEKGERIININEKNKHGNTGFMRACGAGKLEVVKYLCELIDESGSMIMNINEKNVDGFSGFMLACCDGKLELVQYLYSLKIITIGEDEIFAAEKSGNQELIEYLKSKHN